MDCGVAFVGCDSLLNTGFCGASYGVDGGLFVLSPQDKGVARRFVVLMFPSSGQYREEAFRKGFPWGLPLVQYGGEVYLDALVFSSHFLVRTAFCRDHVLDALWVVRGAFLNCAQFVVAMLPIVRDRFGRLFLVLAVFPSVVVRLLAMLIRFVEVIRLEVFVDRFMTFAFHRFSCFEDRHAQRFSAFSRGRVPYVIVGRHPSLLSLRRLRGVRRDRVLRVLTGQYCWE